MFLCDGKKIDVWKLTLVSTTKDSCLGDRALLYYEDLIYYLEKK